MSNGTLINHCGARVVARDALKEINAPNALLELACCVRYWTNGENLRLKNLPTAPRGLCWRRSRTLRNLDSGAIR